MAQTDPTGAPSSAMPSVPSVSPRCSFTWGMGAVHDANNSPCTTNTPVTAIRGQRRGGGVEETALGKVDVDTVGLQRGEHVGRCGLVGDTHVECRQLPHYRQRASTELGAVQGEHTA